MPLLGSEKEGLRLCERKEVRSDGTDIVLAFDEAAAEVDPIRSAESRPMAGPVCELEGRLPPRAALAFVLAANCAAELDDEASEKWPAEEDGEVLSRLKAIESKVGTMLDGGR